jgi:hypothetical protein
MRATLVQPVNRAGLIPFETRSWQSQPDPIEAKGFMCRFATQIA